MTNIQSRTTDPEDPRLMKLVERKHRQEMKMARALPPPDGLPTSVSMVTVTVFISIFRTAVVSVSVPCCPAGQRCRQRCVGAVTG